MDIKALIVAKKERLQEKLEAMDKGQRQTLYIILAVVSIAGIVRLYSINFGEIAQMKKSSQSQTIIADTKNVDMPDTKILRELPQNPRNTGLDDLQLKVEELTRKNEGFQRMLESLTAQKQKNDPIPPVAPGTPLPGSQQIGIDIPPIDTSHIGVSDSKSDSMNTKPSRSAEFMVVGAEVKPGSGSRKKSKPDLTIPRGSGLQSVTLTGVDAFVDTTSNSQKPNVTGKGASTNLFTPFVAKVKGEAIMANGWKNTALVDCTITGSAMGNLSSERAYLRGEGITCISESGEIFEGEMNAVGFGEDGKPGVTGTVVSKSGSLLMKTFLAGTVGGLAQMFAPTPLMGYNSNVSGNSQQQYQWPNPGMAAQGAIANGFQKSADQLAKFYLDYAKQMMPVIEIVGGKRVTFVLQESLTISKFIANQ